MHYMKRLKRNVFRTDLYDALKREYFSSPAASGGSAAAAAASGVAAAADAMMLHATEEYVPKQMSRGKRSTH